MNKILLKTLDVLSPSLAAKEVHRIMSEAQSRKLRKFEETALNKAEQVDVEFNGTKIKTYTWGEDCEKTVFLVHGWEGHAGNFGAIIDILLDKGYCVVSFDAPSHGQSENGNHSMYEFADFVSMMIGKYRPNTIISHSFGSVTSIMAISGNPSIKIDKWMLVTTPYDFKDRIKQFTDHLQVSDRTVKAIYRLFEKETGAKINTMNMKNYGKKIENIGDALIIHSKDDIVLPIEWARQTHNEFPNSKLIELEKVGHFNILWSDKLKRIVKEYL